MSGRATGEERSPLSTLDRERERERRPSPPFHVSRSKRPALSSLLPLPRGVRVSIAATLIHLVNHCWPSSVGREGDGGSTIDFHRAVTVSSIRRWIAATADAPGVSKVAARAWIDPPEFRFAGGSILLLFSLLCRMRAVCCAIWNFVIFAWWFVYSVLMG